ncbi:MAG: hypothetical protein HFG37_07345 [Eubacterium sp.]|nr:hypothetical protein [Eubacterium sp.]
MITNKDLKMCNEQVFSYSAAYQVPFFGRDAAMEEMQELNSGLKPGEALIISQPLGTGKTFLVNHMISVGKLDLPMGASFLTVRGITEDPRNMEIFPGDTLVIDEADIKTPVKKLKKGLDLLADYLNSSKRKAIILGDYSLKNQNISGKLEHVVPLLKFGDMDRDFLKGVLEQRFKHFLNLEEFEIADVIESELLDYLTPDWMKPVNTFRGIFSLLQQVTANDKYIRYNGERAFLTMDMVHDLLYKDGIMQLDRDQNSFLQLLCDYIREMYPKGNGITVGFQREELYDLAKKGGMNMGLQEFTDNVLYPFATADLLVSTGIPEYEGSGSTFVRRPAPYVPSLRLLLSL